jgi:hypothetical protein
VQNYTKLTGKLCIFMENKMITAEMKEKMFEDAIKTFHPNKVDGWMEIQAAREGFDTALDLILPLLEKSLEANRFYADPSSWWPHNGNHRYRIQVPDRNEISKEWEGTLCGGKTARQAIATIESELKQLGGKDNE